jgi:hypothetical protein
MAALDFTDFYNGSFAGVPFWEQAPDGFFAAGADALEETAKLRIPGGDVTVIQKFGLATRTFEKPVAMMAADYAAMVAKRGQTGTLIHHGGTITVFLDGLLQPRETDLELGIWNVTLRFTL